MNASVLGGRSLFAISHLCHMRFAVAFTLAIYSARGSGGAGVGAESGRRRAIAFCHLSPLSHALAVAFTLIRSGLKSCQNTWCSRAKAFFHFLPLSHEVITTFTIIKLSSTCFERMRSNKATAFSHRSPLEQAKMVALWLMTSAQMVLEDI